MLASANNAKRIVIKGPYVTAPIHVKFSEFLVRLVFI